MQNWQNGNVYYNHFLISLTIHGHWLTEISRKLHKMCIYADNNAPVINAKPYMVQNKPFNSVAQDREKFRMPILRGEFLVQLRNTHIVIRVPIFNFGEASPLDAVC